MIHSDKVVKSGMKLLINFSVENVTGARYY